jgi:hypothetical protein
LTRSAVDHPVGLGQVVLRAGEHDPARVDDSDVVGDAFQVRGDVGREQHRRVATGDVLGEDIEQVVAGDRVQPRGRLVQDEQPGVMREGRGQHQHQAHAVRELGALSCPAVARTG